MWGVSGAAREGRGFRLSAEAGPEPGRLLRGLTLKGLCKNVSRALHLTEVLLVLENAVLRKNVTDTNMYGFIVIIFKGMTI